MYKNERACTPLHEAVIKNNKEIAQLLLDHKLVILQNREECFKIILENTKKLTLRPYKYTFLLKKYLPDTQKAIKAIVYSFKRISQKLSFKLPKPIILIIIDYLITSQEELISVIEYALIQEKVNTPRP